MRLLLRILAARIRNKIVLPYLLLALLLAVVTTFLAVRYTAGALQDRLNNRLAEAGQVTSDGLVAIEERHLEQLRSLVFTSGVAQSFANSDSEQLQALMRPLWVNAGLHTLVAFDPSGQPLFGWQRDEAAQASALPSPLATPDLPSWWLVEQIVRQQSDRYGDKFSAFREAQLWTVAPVHAADGRLVGGLMLATPLTSLLSELQGISQANITTFYDGRGIAVATTQIVAGDAVVPPISVETLKLLLSTPETPTDGHIQDVALINGRDYQFAYSPLQIRRSMDGFFSVALPRSFIATTWESQRIPLVLIGLTLIAAVVGVGLLIARQITSPLNDLVVTAQAVGSGDLHRRSNVHSRDELGVLSRTFNQMTSRLLHLYTTSRTLSMQSHIEAILEETNQAIQPLVPDAISLVILEEGDTWVVMLPPQLDGHEALRAWPALDRPADVRAIALQANGLTVAKSDAPQLAALHVPAIYTELCYTALNVHGQLFGLLVILHREPGAFAISVLDPLFAVVGMASTAFNNVRLYRNMQEEGAQRKAILEGIADAVVVCDSQRNVTLMNPAAEQVFGITDWNERRYHFNELPMQRVMDHNLLLDEDEIQARYEVNGQIMSSSRASFAGLADNGGEVIVLHNISAEVALDKAKTNLIAMISHELRTPLTAIQSAADMLTKEIGGPLSQIQQELAGTALRNTQAMRGLIDKALLVTNIESGSLKINMQPVGLITIVETAIQPLRADAEAMGTSIRLDVSSEIPFVEADSALLIFAVRQLIDNAIKYGEGSPIVISAEQRDEEVALWVDDSGPGIPAENQPHLFKRLRRTENSNNEAQRGLGLGLAIAHELIAQQGGTITVQSVDGQGSRFTILLRAVQAANPIEVAYDA